MASNLFHVIFLSAVLFPSEGTKKKSFLVSEKLCSSQKLNAVANGNDYIKAINRCWAAWNNIVQNLHIIIFTTFSL